MHAVLSASGAHRWIVCPPSARLEEGLPDTTSPSAAEGTFAHAWAENQLGWFLHEKSDAEYKKYIENAKKDNFYSLDLEDYVQVYIDLVIEKSKKAEEIFLERHLDFSDWVPQGFGQGDAVLISDGKLEIIDLKYGRNVAVSAINNPQLRLYALGAYVGFNLIHNIKEITMTICQPRNGGVSSEILSIDELLKWGEKIRAKAKIAFDGKGEFKAGNHCIFCKVRDTCKCLKEYNFSIVKYQHKDMFLMSDTELADVFKKIDSVVSYANSIKDYCLKRALDGNPINGYKLVEGRSVSKYSDSVEKILLDAGYKDIYKPKELLGVTALKKLISTKKFNELLGEHLIKGQGKPTLVPIDDKRAEINSVKNDFDVIEKE